MKRNIPKNRTDLILTGATGMLGAKLLVLLDDLSPIAASRTLIKNQKWIHFDLETKAGFDELASKPTTVIHAAAISSPDECARDETHAMEVNVNASATFFKSVLNQGGRIIFLSSDTVYAGGETVYTEKSTTNSTVPYGRMKCLLEDMFVRNPNFVSLRLANVIHADDPSTQMFKRHALEGTVAEVFDKFMRRSVSLYDLESTIRSLIQLNNWSKYPVVNVCGPRLLTRAAIAEAFKECFDNRLKYRSVNAPAHFFKNRPPKIDMQSCVLQELIARPLTSIQEAYTRISKRQLSTALSKEES
tara:strand:- start:3939 stop:4844 length:906 start_codon:yes stop_codon:yes gene_type:complete